MNGVVVDAFGAPVAGITVYVPGHSPTITVADGTFQLADVAVPYDITFVDAELDLAHTLVGITSAELRVAPIGVLSASASPAHSTTVSGDLVHDELVPLMAGYGATVCVEGLDAHVVGCRDFDAVGTAAYEVSPSWSSPEEVTVRVWAFVYTLGAGGVPEDIVVAGYTGTTVLSPDAGESLDMQLAAVSQQATVDFTASLPVGYALEEAGLVAHHSPFASAALPTGTATSTSGSLVAPFFPGSRLTAHARAGLAAGGQAVAAAWVTGLSAGGEAALVLPTPPAGVTPPDGATGVPPDAEFRAANPSGGVLTFAFQPVDGWGAGPVRFVTAATDVVRLPDLGVLGLDLPSGTDYGWVVFAAHHLSSVDEVVTGDYFDGGYQSIYFAARGAGVAPGRDGQASQSEPYFFTTE